MPQAGRPRGRSDESWERVLYFILLVVAIVVILYSLFGIATLLGYLPLSKSGGGGKPLPHSVFEAQPSRDRIADRPTMKADAVDKPCEQRANLKLMVSAPAMTSSAVTQMQAGCAKIGADHASANSAAAPRRLNTGQP
jgi:hypothetical protein